MKDSKRGGGNKNPHCKRDRPRIKVNSWDHGNREKEERKKKQTEGEEKGKSKWEQWKIGLQKKK